MKRRITADRVFICSELCRNKTVTVEDGIITAVDDCPAPDACASTEYYNGILTAGFVNAHLHLELSYLRSQIEPRTGFRGFAEGIHEKRDKFSDAEREASAAFWDAKMQSEGIVAAGDICNGATTFEIKRRSGIRYHSFIELFGLSAQDCSPVADTFRAAHSAGIVASVTPHSLYSLNDSAFRSAVEASEGILSIHFEESPDEKALFRGCGAMREWYDKCGFDYGDLRRYASPTERLLRLVPKERRVMLIHACCVTADEVQRINEYFLTPPVWVVCPRSNDFISGLRPPLDILRDTGSTIAVGTDSLSSNTSLDMVAELRAMPDAPLTERLDWTTRRGAEALGISDAGEIRVGARCGLTLIEGVDFDTMQLTSHAHSRRIL